MHVANKIAALVEVLRRDRTGFESMPPAQRQHLAALCRYIADKADPKPEPKAPKAQEFL